MKFEKPFEAFSTDAGHNHLVRPAAIVRYLQEAAVHQMLTEGPSYRQLWEQGLAFILSRLNLRLYLPLYEYERFTVQTWACAERGASFGRSYRLVRGDDVVAEAVAVWALVDVNNQTLIRAEETNVHYGAHEPLDIPFRFAFPRVMMSEVDTRTVRYEDIDCNGHLNNARYPDWLCNCVPDIDRKRVTELQIHYVKEAPLGEQLTILRGDADDGETCLFETRLENGDCNIRARIVTKEWTV